MVKHYLSIKPRYKSVHSNMETYEEKINNLSPKRLEIYNTIKDHKILMLENIKRRFLFVNERTLRYDLKKLQDQGLIIKRGVTRGACYEVKNK